MSESLFGGGGMGLADLAGAAPVWMAFFACVVAVMHNAASKRLLLSSAISFFMLSILSRVQQKYWRSPRQVPCERHGILSAEVRRIGNGDYSIQLPMMEEKS